MSKFHVSTDGNPRVCTAADGNCPLGGNENHFTSKEAARAAFEESVKSIRTVNEWGDVEWINSEGQIHRDYDLPAIESPDGSKAWYRNGQLHRDGDLPAIEFADGSKAWYQNGEVHREGDLPAIEAASGLKEWWVNGKRHRDGGLPAIERWNGIKEWWVNGRLLRRVSDDGTDSDLNGA